MDIIEEIQEPEYIGENRCLPCTLVNMIISGLLSSVIARKSRVSGYMTMFCSLMLIYLRGYVVPGTPSLTKQYLPRRVLRWFGKDADVSVNQGLDNSADPSYSEEKGSKKTGSNQSSTEADGIDPHEYLLTEGVLEPCEAIDDLCTSSQFRTQWNDEISVTIEQDIDVGLVTSALNVSDNNGGYQVEDRGEAKVLIMDQQTIGQWPSEKALIADIAGARVLQEWSNRWKQLSTVQKGSILNALRLFLETCPGNDSEVTMSQETVSSCCSSQDVVALLCDDGDRLFEHPMES